MEYAIFPMSTISISNPYSTSHRAWDITGHSTSAYDPSDFYAPCRVKILKLLPYNNPGDYLNTVIFGSCNEDGEPAEVMCADGVPRVLTFACSHMDIEDYNAMGYYVGEQFFSGQKCYKEGTLGVDINNSHVHLEVGLGWEFTKGANACLRNTLTAEKDENGNKYPLINRVFCQLYYYHDEGNANIPNGINIPVIDTRGEIFDSSELSGIYLKAQSGAFRIRDAVGNGNILTTINTGGSAQILKFLPGFIEGSDLKYYQWAKVKSGSYTGYAQLDLKGYYNIVKNVGSSNIYLKAVNEKFYVRTAVVSGSSMALVPLQSRAQVLTVNSGFESDGYQWAQTSYNGCNGWSQMDTINAYQLEG